MRYLLKFLKVYAIVMSLTFAPIMSDRTAINDSKAFNLMVGDGFLETIIIWGVGIAGGYSLYQCKTPSGMWPTSTPYSFYVFNVASVAYLVMEVFSDKKDIEDVDAILEGASIEEVEGPNGNSTEPAEVYKVSAQAESYKKAAEVSKTNQETLEKKANARTVVSVAWLAAAALAVWEWLYYDYRLSADVNRVTGTCLAAAYQSSLLPEWMKFKVLADGYIAPAEATFESHAAQKAIITAPSPEPTSKAAALIQINKDIATCTGMATNLQTALGETLTVSQTLEINEENTLVASETQAAAAEASEEANGTKLAEVKALSLQHKGQMAEGHAEVVAMVNAYGAACTAAGGITGKMKLIVGRVETLMKTADTNIAAMNLEAQKFGKVNMGLNTTQAFKVVCSPEDAKELMAESENIQTAALNTCGVTPGGVHTDRTGALAKKEIPRLTALQAELSGDGAPLGSPGAYNYPRKNGLSEGSIDKAFAKKEASFLKVLTAFFIPNANADPEPDPKPDGDAPTGKKIEAEKPESGPVKDGTTTPKDESSQSADGEDTATAADELSTSLNFARLGEDAKALKGKTEAEAEKASAAKDSQSDFDQLTASGKEGKNITPDGESGSIFTSILTMGGFQYVPWYRAPLYGVFGAIALWSSFNLREKADKAGEDADKYMALYNSLTARENIPILGGVPVPTGGGTGGPGTTTTGGSQPPPSTIPVGELPGSSNTCADINGNIIPCDSCQANNTCGNALPNIDGGQIQGFTGSSILAQSGVQARNLASGLLGGNRKQVADASSFFNKNAGNIKNLKNQLQRQLDERLVRRTGQPSNLNAKTDRLLSAFKNITAKRLKSKGLSGGGGAGGGLASVGSLDGFKDAKLAAYKPVSTAPAVKGVRYSSKKSTSSRPKFNFGKGPIGAARTTDVSSGKLGKLDVASMQELQTNTINSNKGGNIFKIISNRYMRTATRKLFQVKKD